MKPRFATLSDLPKACAAVLAAPAASGQSATVGTAYVAPQVQPASQTGDAAIQQVINAGAGDLPDNTIPIPVSRPSLQ